ncbi:hypothetical protein PS2_009182 [Malus domestica]
MEKIVNSSSSDCVNSKSSGVQYSFEKCRISLDSIVSYESDTWLFESGCSYHMTGDKDMFPSFMPFRDNKVEFGKGNKAEIIGNGRIKVLGIPLLEDICYVPELLTSLLNINQLCDDVVDEVCFSKNGCKVVDKNGKIMLTIPRPKENCYALVGLRCDIPSMWDEDICEPRFERKLSQLFFFACQLCEVCNLEDQIIRSYAWDI